MKKILLIIFSLLVNTAYAQQEAANWFFGVNAGITFTTNPPTALAGGQLVTNEGSATISDANGSLLFYSDGTNVFDRNHALMPNGTGLNGSSTCTQSALFVPYPGNDSLYYLFTPPDEFTSPGWFCYSIIDLTLNGGFGDVINKNTPLFSQSTEKVTAVRHANGTDYWVIGHRYGNADFYAYQITASGINSTPVISSVGSPHAGGIEANIGVMKASPCGDKLALVVHSDFFELFDFDQSTGIVSNPIQLANITVSNAWGLYATEFSPNGSRLYVVEEHPAIIVQYDLLAGSSSAIIASADTIINLPFAYFGALQNGPDGKMYISRFSTSFPYLSCLNNPDSLGIACNFVDTAVVANGQIAHGLPNFMSSYFCNESTGIYYVDSKTEFSVFPNPASDIITIELSEVSGKSVRVDLLSTLSHIVQSVKINEPITGQTLDFNISSLPAGFYFVKVSGDEITRIKKVLKY